MARILVVDDEETNRNLLRDLLQAEVYWFNVKWNIRVIL